ncbi:hypothetical protein SAMD00019534_069200 [Acytostelium subglobosum LB1]|uniref:hypothetical protein n=1 Tax=Acytostelium subglobosum LB1 TaxID=1410327 RepID=UPI000644DB5C|nr:hypothetical protein SAMD00019534_069200 [Acytostelium subglobosum LB1]GAM23745.1 hypothetical protein SAMD00019534_069200 [Acytostelium subglobosum LB1]|eukprot:XP_012753486.1 hypothetical protein SAMD00019534_069200 [Acytostelium subglobosum LB1]
MSTNDEDDDDHNNDMSSQQHQQHQQHQQQHEGQQLNVANASSTCAVDQVHVGPTPTTTTNTTLIDPEVLNQSDLQQVNNNDNNNNNNQPKRTKKEFDFIKTIGRGSYGKVKLVIDKLSGMRFAAKVMSKHLLAKEKKAKYAFAEKTILESLDHPFIVKLYYTFQDDTNLFIMLEYCENGDLLELLREAVCFPLPIVQFYAAEVLVAVEYLHSRGIVHRDLKPENVLLSTNYHIRLCDFGTAKQLGPDPHSLSASFCGTAEYVCPELLVDKKAGRQADIWSYGCLLFQLITGKLPFKGLSDYYTFQLIMSREMVFPPDFDPDAQDLIDRLLTLDPFRRPTIEEIKSHPFFKSINWNDIHTQVPPPITRPVKQKDFQLQQQEEEYVLNLNIYIVDEDYINPMVTR